MPGTERAKARGENLRIPAPVRMMRPDELPAAAPELVSLDVSHLLDVAVRKRMDSVSRLAASVEDTFNLPGHALRKALGVIAAAQGWGQVAGTATIAAQAGVRQLAAPIRLAKPAC